MKLNILATRTLSFVKNIGSLLFKKLEYISNNYDITKHIITNLSHHNLKRPYREGQPVKIVFLFQAASFWSSWESVWNACQEDNRFNTIMLVCDDAISEKTQFKTAQSFLKKKNIPFQHISEVNLSEIAPHIVVLHTPYDGHRPKYLHSYVLSSRGYRLVYITYGIEISDSYRARSDHFTRGVTTNAWRIYTFSKEMIPEYKMFSPTGGDMVRSFGHPKFDYLNKKYFPTLPEEITNKANGRKIVLWKVHFPKKVFGKTITPSIKMYEKLLNTIKTYDDVFFIFMPHPKFYEKLPNFTNVNKFRQKVNKTENIFEFVEDDYRPVLINCDYYIIDRSALMVEAGVTQKPILYISTKPAEPLTNAVQKIIDSYYQACTFKEIITFLDEVVVAGHDPLKEKRINIFNEVIPNSEAKAGYQIKEDMIDTLKKETLSSSSRR